MTDSRRPALRVIQPQEPHLLLSEVNAYLVRRKSFNGRPRKSLRVLCWKWHRAMSPFL